MLGENYNDGTNISSDPTFIQGYFNTLQAAATIDEGGNNISVRFDELDLNFGDYHLANGSSAVDAGDNRRCHIPGSCHGL